MLPLPARSQFTKVNVGATHRGLFIDSRSGIECHFTFSVCPQGPHHLIFGTFMIRSITPGAIIRCNGSNTAR